MTVPPDDPVADLERARDDLAAARAALHAAVAAARAAGRSWAEVGATLGVSRQAAFKRFATPTDPRDGTPMTRRTAPAASALTERALALLAAGDLVALRAMMSAETAAALGAEALGDAWARAVADTGPLERIEEVGVRHLDGTWVAEGEEAVGSLVGVVRLVCEAGDWEGRVASDGDGRVTGLLICAPGADDAPF